jgi:hypothetical protein
MNQVIRNRTIRPSSRHKSSNNYRVDTSTVKEGTTLIVNIHHESKPFLKSYKFNWRQVIGRNITFSTKLVNGKTLIKWNKVNPVEINNFKGIILCRIAWMKYYEGRANIDIPISGAKYILRNKKGGEIYNFKNRNGKVYGYFPFINSPELQNLGAERNANVVKNVTVVFCAKHPKEGGIRVVGWYKKASVYSYSSQKGDNQAYHTMANSRNVTRICENDRIFFLTDVFGRSSLFYFSKHPEKNKLLSDLETYIACKGNIEKYKSKSNRKSKKGRAYQPDPLKRLLVEQKAIESAFKYYGERYGYENVHNVDKENKGWDLEVRLKSANINIEVKGNSGNELFVQLTPNEYSFFKRGLSNYHLFVVNNTLEKKPTLRIFQYQKKGKLWISDDKSVLKVEKVNSARITLI